MKKLIIAAMLCGAPPILAAQTLLDEKIVAALANEISGESAKRHLEYLTRQHRMRGSRQFRLAAEHIESALKSYGLADARIERLVADGKVFYGTQRSRPAWNADFAELWEVDEQGDRVKRLASWDSMPITLAQDSHSGEATAELVEDGDVKGKFLLTSLQPEMVQDRGAAGIISYAQNQRTAWWGEDENLVRWGHLDTFNANRTFAFMVSLKQARDFQRRLAAGEKVRLHAVVRAGQEPGFYDIATGTIAGSDPSAGEIIFSCHLDHPRPGANDNASGCATILEVARSLQKLRAEGRLPAPRRTMRFVWPPEIEGTVALLNAWPELAGRLKAAIHLDMVGGGPATKATFHITRSPASLPTFVNDVAEDFGRFVNEQSAAFAGSGVAKYPLVAAEGGKEPLAAEMARFSMGSDHQVYTDSSFSIPAIYLNDWPDRYIHTNGDVPANIDPTKLKRAAFIAAASGWFLANFTAADAPRVLAVLEANEFRRRAAMLERKRVSKEPENVQRFHDWYEAEVRASVQRFDGAPPARRREEGPRAPQRNPAVKGPVSVFGYDYLEDKYGADRVKKLQLTSFGGQYAYEVLNLVNGQRTPQEIRDMVSAIYGPVPLEAVNEYLGALESVGLIRR